MKLAERLIVRRLMGLVEPFLTECQYAYQRQRSAEVLLADIDSFVQESSGGSWVTYIVGLDIEGAFDTADLDRLLDALEGIGAPGVLCRFIGNWLTVRTFRVRLLAPSGQYLSSPYTQTRGVPQGGVLSPLLWLLLINGLPDKVRGQMKNIRPKLDVDKDLMIQIFADDISIALRGRTAAEVAEIANKLGKILHEVLREIGLQLSSTKCKNFIVQLLRGTMQLFKRCDPTSRWFKGKEKIRQKALQAKDEKGSEKAQGGAVSLPFQSEMSFKLLGLTLDNVWSFHTHMSDTQRKMRMRIAILNKVSNSVWGLENRILTITVHALIESLFSYGLTVTGSASPLEDFEDIDKQILNPVARRVTGVGFSARREIIYPLADIRSAHNHFLLKVANVLDRTLRARQTQAQKRLRMYTSRAMKGLDIWKPEVKFIKMKDPTGSRPPPSEEWISIGNQSGWDMVPKLEEISWWQYNPENQESREEGELMEARETSIYHAQAEEIRIQGDQAGYIFHYDGLKDWRDVALKVLRSVGWTPECVFESTIYPQEMGTNEINWNKLTGKTMGPQEDKAKVSGLFRIFVVEGVTEGLAASTTIVKRFNKTWTGAVHILGRTCQKEPWALTGLALAASTRYLEQSRLQEDHGTDPFKPGSRVEFYTNYTPLHDPAQIKRWRIYGAPNQPSPEHETINRILTKWTKDLSNVTIALKDKNEALQEWEAIKELSTKWVKERQRIKPTPKRELRPIPLSQTEVKELLKKKQDKDEAETIKHLAMDDGIQSVASSIYRSWDLNRKTIKDCHIAMSHDRQLQVTFNNIVAATRFKTFEGQKLVRARCQKRGCGSVDSWEHFLQCYEVPDISRMKGQEKVKRIVEICEKAKEPNPIRPKPSEMEYKGAARAQ